MPIYLTASASPNVSEPNISHVVVALHNLFNGGPVLIKTIAASLGCDALPVDNALRQAERAGLVRLVSCQGWVPLT